jgi:hypothetical protein
MAIAASDGGSSYSEYLKKQQQAEFQKTLNEITARETAKVQTPSTTKSTSTQAKAKTSTTSKAAAPKATSTKATTKNTGSSASNKTSAIKQSATTINKGADAYADVFTGLVSDANKSAGTFNYNTIAPMKQTAPTLLDADTLAKMYGLDYNYNNIYNMMMDNVDKGYESRYADQATAENNYYDDAAAAQNTLLDTLSQQQSQAIATGASRGAQAANALSAVLGLSQNFASGATQLADARAQLSKQKAADVSQAGVNAFNTYNTMGQQLADISKNVYSSDTSRYVGGLDYNAAAASSNAQMAAQKMASQAQYQSSYNNNLADILNQYMSGRITLEQAQIAANAQVQSARQYGAEAAIASSGSNERAAAIAAGATRYAADMNRDASNIAATANKEASMYGANMQLANSAQQRGADANMTVVNNLTGLLEGVRQGTTTPAAARSMLTGMYQQGMIGSTVYQTYLQLFQ